MHAAFVAALSSIIDAEQQARAAREAADHAADAFRYATAAARPQGVVIDVEAREVPEPLAIGFDLAAPERATGIVDHFLEVRSCTKV